MVERGDRALITRRGIATFYAPTLATGTTQLVLGADAAHHARVRRLGGGEIVRVSSGTGFVGVADVVRAGKNELELDVRGVDQIERPIAIQLCVPVGDRERMLWLAEKITELGIAHWQPVLFHRSRSVSPRGEGTAFAARVRARMISALEQSGAAYLPEVGDEITVEQVAVDEHHADHRYLLDAAGDPILSRARPASATIVLGPEGGLEIAERQLLVDAGWAPVSLGANTLRFETAGVAAVAVLRAVHAHGC